MHKARHRQAVNGLGAMNGVTTSDDGAGLIGLGIAAPQDFLHRMLVHFFRNAHDVQRQPGLAAHGVHIAEGVGGGDLPVHEGVVHNGWEEVGGLHYGKLLAHRVNAGIVAFVVAHQKLGVRMSGEALQQLAQGAGADLGAAAGTAGQLG